MLKWKAILAAGALAAGLAAARGTVAAETADAPPAAAKVKPYILDKCPVSDEKLGEMGEPFKFAHKGREIKLCCKHCLADFKKDPAKYIKKIEKAEKDQKKS